MAQKPRFELLKSTDGNWYWTCFLPEQRKKFKTREEAMASMGGIVVRIQETKFEIVEHELAGGKAAALLVGGMSVVKSAMKKAQLAEKAKPKKAKG